MSVPSCISDNPSLALLAGGRATRLGRLTERVPKSLLPVAGEPFIAHQMRLIVSQGICDVVICCGHLGKQIESFMGDGRQFGCRVRYSSDGIRPLGTGGAIRKALPVLGSRPTISTLAPSAAKTRAIPLPMPRLEPVITAVLAFNLPPISNLSVADGSLRSLESWQRSLKPLYC